MFVSGSSPPLWPAAAASLRSASCCCSTGLPPHASAAATSAEPPAAPSEPGTPAPSLPSSAPFGPAGEDRKRRGSTRQLGKPPSDWPTPGEGRYLLQLLLGVFLPASLVLSSLPELAEPLSFLLGRVDLAAELLLHLHLLHPDVVLLLLGLLQSEGNGKVV